MLPNQLKYKTDMSGYFNWDIEVAHESRFYCYSCPGMGSPGSSGLTLHTEAGYYIYHFTLDQNTSRVAVI